MNDQQTKEAIQNALRDVGRFPLGEAATRLLHALGYTSQKGFALTPNSAANFQETFARDQALDPKHSLLPEWQSIDFLFQITDEEVQMASGDSQQLPFESKGKWDGSVMQSYLFFAIALRGADYTRADLAGITRSVNRLFPMPVMVVFRHGQTLSFGIIRRRLHKRDESKDVLEKVTLIKDIRCDDPVRAHIEILHDLSLSALYERFYFHNFVGLHDAWEKRLNTYVLNEQFYREIANWYFWALKHGGVTLPRSVTAIRSAAEREKQISIFFIRLLTRLIFVGFFKRRD
jgi:adenine-specific DNA-methyltransferase